MALPSLKQWYPAETSGRRTFEDGHNSLVLGAEVEIGDVGVDVGVDGNLDVGADVGADVDSVLLVAFQCTGSNQ